MQAKVFIPLFFFAFILMQDVSAQIPNCDSLVPVFNIDFTAATSDSTWVSSSVSRDGNCCGTIPPDRCIHFAITTGINTVAIVFGMPGCPLPSGSITYQIDCGIPVHFTDTTFIFVPGLYHLTYCKPGNLPCSYSITSLSILTAVIETEISASSFITDFSGNYFFNLNLDSPQSFTLNIFSVDGKSISERKYQLTEGKHSIPLPTQEIKEGIYFVQLKSSENSVTKKLVVAR